MKTSSKFNYPSISGLVLLAITLCLSACSGGSSSSGGSGTVTGVATPSKVSVVNTN